MSAAREVSELGEWKQGEGEKMEGAGGWRGCRWDSLATTPFYEFCAGRAFWCLRGRALGSPPSTFSCAGLTRTACVRMSLRLKYVRLRAVFLCFAFKYSFSFSAQV